MNNYVKHFRREISILEGLLKEGETLNIKDIIPEIEAIAEKFADEGHSGASAAFTSMAIANTIRKVLSFKPLSPITGDESEWSDSMGQGMFQNKRLSSLFKDVNDERPYYLDAIIWSGESEHDTFGGIVDGVWSRQYVKLPFTPKTFYIDVVKDADGEYHIKDRTQLDAVFAYYDEYK